MRRWKQVKWTEAGQVAAILGWPASKHDAEPPEAAFDRLRAEGRDDDAALFLGQALPRFEAVAWAAQSVRRLAPVDAPEGDAQALKAALLWLQDPSGFGGVLPHRAVKAGLDLVVADQDDVAVGDGMRRGQPRGRAVDEGAVGAAVDQPVGPFAVFDLAVG